MHARDNFTDAGGGRLHAQLRRRGDDMALTYAASNGVDGRRRWHSGMRDSAATYAGRRRRGEAANSQSMRRHTYPGVGDEGDNGMAHSETRGQKQSGGGFGHGCRGGAVKTWAWRCHDGAFKARCGRGHVAATWIRLADERARRGEREADSWDPAAAIFRIKNTPGRK
jgi:hypothetical protein